MLSAEYILSLGTSVGSMIACCALARRMAGSVVGYGVYSLLHFVAIVACFVFLGLVER